MTALTNVMKTRGHWERCFTFEVPPVGTPVPCRVLARGAPFTVGDSTWVILGIHTGCSLPPSENAFRLYVGLEEQLSVTFDTLAAFFPLKASFACCPFADARRIGSYILGRSVYLPARTGFTPALALTTIAGLADISRTAQGLATEITITCVGVLTRDVL